MSGLSIAITGDGQLFQIWPTHAMSRFPRATIYDRSAAVTAFRQAEVKLGQQGWLDRTGQTATQRTAQNLANPPVVDATLTFAGPIQNGTVTVKCKSGNEKVFQVRLTGLEEKAIKQAFFHVDAAINRCKAAGSLV
tara:strand:+ start:22715 stop:23122 length:408 start_codon:yes stop_codon:yes gene_type:complete